MRKLILVSKTPIIHQIFDLVSKKLTIELEILDDLDIKDSSKKVDIIIVEKNLIDERFNILKTHSKRVGAISKTTLPFEMANDFLIPSPFYHQLYKKF